MHKQASWQLTYYFISYKCKWTSAYATCLRRKKLHCLRACLRTPTRTVKYQVNSLRSCIRSSLEYMRLVIGKKTMLTWSMLICWCLLKFFPHHFSTLFQCPSLPRNKLPGRYWNDAWGDGKTAEDPGLLQLNSHKWRCSLNLQESSIERVPSWWFQPLWTIRISQNGNLPQIGVKIKNIFETTTQVHMCHGLNSLYWGWSSNL